MGSNFTLRVGRHGPGLFFALRGINNSKAKGLAAVI